MNRFFVLIAIFVLGVVAAPFVTHAQSAGFGESVTILTTPEYPKPLEKTSLKVRSFSTDLDAAEFNWIVNGKTYQKGTGLKDIEITMGKPGTLTAVSVVIKTRNGQTVTQTLSFRPADVTLIWEADTYKPPFYKGHSDAAFGSTFRITALPEFFDKKGVRMNPKDLIYTWKKNYEVVGSASGYGKDSFITTKAGYLQEDEVVSVEVSSPRESVTGSASITISPKTPKVLFYVNEPAQGINFSNAIQNNIGALKSVEIFAVPFGISKTPNIELSWSIDGVSILDYWNKRDIIVDERLNNMEITAQARNTGKLLQVGQGSFVTNFKTE